MDKIKKIPKKYLAAIAVLIAAVVFSLIFIHPGKSSKPAKKVEKINVAEECDIILDSSYYKYTGKPIKPKVRLVFGDVETNVLDINPKLYTVKYKNNVNPGMATVTVNTHGKKLKGSHTRTFFIVKGKASKVSSPLYITAGTRKFYGSLPVITAMKEMAAYCDSDISEAQIKKDLYAWRRTITKEQFMEFYKAWDGFVCGMDFMYDDAETNNFEGYKAQFKALGCYKEVKSHMNKRGHKNWKIIKKYIPDISPDTYHDLPLQEAVE